MGELLELDRDEFVARDIAHRLEDDGILHAPGGDLIRDHQVAWGRCDDQAATSDVGGRARPPRTRGQPDALDVMCATSWIPGRLRQCAESMKHGGVRRASSVADGSALLAICHQRQHTAGMPSITVRNVPDDVRDELAARAARAGRSLQEHLRAELIELARKPSVEDVLTRARARTRTTASNLPAARILDHRDADRT
ncbi:MAG TPA: hypothetical protein VGQ02_01335 [Candidatus Limnocylindrales bacterium]|nr:hypothetical protein [Candidatus Limnocylindrales bacterium]